MNSVEKMEFENDGSFWITLSPYPNDLEKITLKNFIFYRVRFDEYEYNNLQEMIQEMSIIYKLLENKVLDSIDLKVK